MVVGSDFVFVQRCVSSTFALIWMVYHMYHADRFSTLHWKRLRRLEIKSLMTFIITVVLIQIIVYDIICAYLKYSEGFIEIPNTHVIIPKPIFLWSPQHQKLEHFAMYWLMGYYVMQNLGLFLMQNFWNYLTTSIISTQFIASWHFKVNYVFALIACVLFPASEYAVRDDLVKRESIPSVLGMVCNIIILAYGIRAHYRFGQLIQEQDRLHTNVVTVAKLRYYRNMNKLFMVFVAVTAVGMLLLVSDGLTKGHPFTMNKAVFDLLFAIIIYAHTLLFIILVLIFYPQRSFKLTMTELTSTHGRRALTEISRSTDTTMTKSIPNNETVIQVDMRNTVSEEQRGKSDSDYLP